ncbi:T9SS type A sorting domain-containing protein [Porphyromonas crevioricanis]|uniref:T9SS type A sorting domain-containing protein n=1 Tax=Porphyromonas crevioricanis TaxID=393921 RepID=UPI001267D8F6|nr:T9SS type A sorting domain-containing protein [Porphyromonas crevioricanis]
MKTTRILLAVLIALLVVPITTRAQEEMGEKPTDENYQIMEFPLRDGTIWVNSCQMSKHVIPSEGAKSPEGLFFSYIFINGDTTINQLNYKKVYCTKDDRFIANETNYWGAIRQDKGVVYLRIPQGLSDPETYPNTFWEFGGWHWAGNVAPFNFIEKGDNSDTGSLPNPDQERILYDFNLYEKPQTAYDRVWGNDATRPQFKDYNYEYIAGRWRRTISFKNNSSFGVKWVDGIGAMEGFGFTYVRLIPTSASMLKEKAPGQHLFNIYHRASLLCFLQDDQVVYHDPRPQQDLYDNLILPQENVTAKDCFRADQMLNVEGLTNNPFLPKEWAFVAKDNLLRWEKTNLKTLALYNMKAEQVWVGNMEDKTSVDLSSLPTGLYLYIVTDTQGLRYTGKIYLGE